MPEWIKIKRILRFSLVGICLLVSSIYCSEKSQNKNMKAIDVGSKRQLFIDDLFIAEKTGIKLKLHPAQKTGEQNLKREKDWESATLNWVTILKYQGKYKMWYEAYNVEGWPTSDDTSFCYAESKDGINWNRPELGLFEYKGSKNNNILFRQIGPEGAHSRVHGTCVFIDPSSKPSERYKAVSQGKFTKEPAHKMPWGATMHYNIAGMVSPDGIHWTRLPKSLLHKFADSQYSCFWDTDSKQYVIYGRTSGKHAGRAIGRATSKQFKIFNNLELVLDGNSELFPDCGLYNPAAMKYTQADRAYFMFPSIFNRKTQKLEIYLAVSRDGIKWSWPDPKTPFIGLGKKGEFDSGSLYMGQGMFVEGDEIWQYYGGSPLNHAEGKLENLVKPGNSRTFSRVISRQDGFVSASAGPDGGYFITPPLKFKGNCLMLNVKCKSGGSVKVALLDGDKEIKWRGLKDCKPITTDSINTMVSWTDGDVSQLQGKPIRLKFKLVNADVYAFEFTQGYPYVVK